MFFEIALKLGLKVLFAKEAARGVVTECGNSALCIHRPVNPKSNSKANA